MIETKIDNIENNIIDTEEKDLKEKAIIEAIKKVKDPFQNWTVKEVMKDLLCGEATANEIFKRADFPSVNIGKTKTVTYVAYLVWKSTRKEESDENGKID
ncbi:MAG: hypothetical protein IJW20_07645 [Clostridia bacterium]|nr:hypothetical protein [Clostridia bacterium]